jgi:hypothetical protein
MAKTIKRSKERKQDLVREVRESVDTYSNLFVFSINNMRNNRLKDLRAHWNTSRYEIQPTSILPLWYMYLFSIMHLLILSTILALSFYCNRTALTEPDSTLARTR